MKKSSRKNSKKSSKKLSRKEARKMSHKSLHKTGSGWEKKKIGAAEDKVSKIMEYMEKVDDFIQEKKLYNFWFFPDEKGFKNRITDMNSKDIKQMIKKDLDKYKGRIVCQLTMRTNYKDPQSLPMKAETPHGEKIPIYMHGQIMVFKILDDGNIKATTKSGIEFGWRKEDFEVTKFSLKLLERLVRIAASKKYYCTLTFGCPISYIVKELKKKKIEIDDVLTPLF
jgi:hypothetical protein